jgi:gliding motility-associated protein GldM
MGGGKLPPRQKMIGMMYLVLTALLAMNVSKDVLNAFVVVNKALEKTNENFSIKNASTYNEFDKAMADEKQAEKTRPFFEKAKIAQKIADDLYNHIDLLKKHLIAITDKKEQAIADTLPLSMVDSKDNYDEPTRILIGPETSNPVKGAFTAFELQEKLEEARKTFVNIFNDTLFMKGTMEDMDQKLGLRIEDVEISRTTKESWINGNFYHLPLAAVITNLSKIQTDVRNAEADVINALLNSIGKSDFKFDKLMAKVIAPSSYIISGDEYKADVLLVAYNSTSSPSIYVGDVDSLAEGTNKIKRITDSLSVDGGLGKYSVRTSAEGLQKWSGVVRVAKPDGSTEDYPFYSDYMVAKPSAAVSPTKMNVFYIGVDNPVSISAGGVAPENLSPSITGGGTISGSKGTYNVRVNTPGEATINLNAKFGNDNKSMGAFKFRVKRVPDPVPKFAGKTGSATITKSDLNTVMGVVADLENFDFDLKFTVISFDITATIKGFENQKSSNSNRITDDQRALLKSVTPGAKVYVENIKVKGEDGSTRTLPPINLKVM